MKEQPQWEEPMENDEGAREFVEAGIVITDDDDMPVESIRVDSKSRVTELRRRIEERLDSKRIALEFEYDDVDDLPDSLQ